MRELMAVIVVIGLVGAYFWQIVAIAAVLALVWAVCQRSQRDAALVARADQQHTWALGGDPRGTFGENYTPLP